MGKRVSQHGRPQDETELFKIETVNLTKPRVGPSDKDILAIKSNG